MKTITLFLTLTLGLSGATIVSTAGGGNYHTGSTWVGGVAPADGTDIAIAVGPVVVESNASPGAAGAAGTNAVQCSSGGSFEISQGVTLSPQGDVQVLSGCLVLDKGSTLHITSATYRIKAAAAGVAQFFTSNGACMTTTLVTVTGAKTISSLVDTATGVSPFGSDGHVIASSDCFPATINGGYLSADDVSQGGGFVATWTNFYNLASILPACNGPGCNLSVSNSYFDSTVGDISSQFVMNGTINFSNTWIASNAGISFATPASASYTNVVVTNAIFGYNATHGVVGSLANTVISRMVSLYQWGYASSGSPSTSPDQVFLGNAIPSNSVGAYNTFNSGCTNCVINMGPNVYNIHPHMPQVYNTATIWTGCVLESRSDGLVQNDGIADGNGDVTSISRSIVTSSPSGLAASELSDIYGTHSVQQFTGDHNSMWDVSPIGGYWFERDSGSTTTNIVVAITNNLFYAPSNSTTQYAANNCIENNALTDMMVSTTLNHNGRFNMTASNPGCTGATNQGSSYIGAFSTAGYGTGDLTTDPMFAGGSSLNQYSSILFSSAYLGVVCTHWASGTYAQYACVSDSNASFYGGATINWRCIAPSGTGCGSNEPGQGYTGSSTAAPAAYTYWEPDSDWQIARATQAGNTITDPTIKCTACSYIQAVINWVQSGWRPLNASHRFGDTAGSAMGAVTPTCLGGPGGLSSAKCAGPF
jgi:hypothetical protein